jgi:predicted DNA-binding ArsR family transcriptional regulator
MLAKLLERIGEHVSSKIVKELKDLNMKASEIITIATAIDNDLTEASTEIAKLIQDLRDALANADIDIPPAAETALNGIAVKAKALANIVP